MTLIADIFPKLLNPKIWLDQCLKSPISEDPSKRNMENAPKYVEIWMKAPFPYLLIAVKTINPQKSSLSDMQNLKTI